MSRSRAALCLSASLAVLAGCVEAPAPAPAVSQPVRMTPADLGRIFEIDPASRERVALGAVEAHALADGRLEVLANFANRRDGEADLQAQAVFAAADGTVVGTAPWVTVKLAGRETQTLRFDSPDSRARLFAFRVRPSA
jgi:hypothetical protein